MDEGDRRGVDDVQDEGVDPNNDALISQLRDEVAYLRDENRRKDEIIMQQAMTMRQLIAAPSQEPPEAAETAEEEAERVRRGPPMPQALRRPHRGPGGASGGDSRMDAGTVLHWPVQVVQVVQQLETGETV